MASTMTSCRSPGRRSCRSPASRRRSPTGAPALHAARPDNVLTRGRLQLRRCRMRATPRAAATAEGTLRDRASSSTPISSPRPATRRRGAARTASRSSPARRRPTWTATRPRACSASRPRTCASGPPACGGGFGGKLDVSVQPLLAVAAWVTRRPVRMVYSRTESMASTTKRHPARSGPAPRPTRRAGSLAFAMRGRFQHRRLRLLGTDGRQPRAGACAAGPTGCRTSRTARARSTPTTPPAGAFRGFGVPQAAIAHETLMDDLAEALGPRPLGHPPHQCAGPWRRHALGPGAGAFGRAAAMPRRAEAGLGRGAGARVATHNAARAAAPARRRHRLHVVRLRQHRAAEPLDHAHRAGARRHAHLLQRRRRHRPGLDDRADCRSRPTRWACRRETSASWSATPT